MSVQYVIMSQYFSQAMANVIQNSLINAGKKTPQWKLKAISWLEVKLHSWHHLEKKGGNILKT